MGTFYEMHKGIDVPIAILSRMAMVYDDQHRPIQILDPNDNIWEQQYDTDGRLIARISPMGHTTTYAYDPRAMSH